MRAFNEGNLRSGQATTNSQETVVSDNTNWQRLGFAKPAFEDNCQGNYFPVSAWEDAFAELDIFSRGSDPLLVIPSITGSGKSSFLTQFMARQDNPLSVHYLKARSIFSVRHLLNAISENFTEFRNVSTNTDQYLNELRTVTKEAGPQLLIIDDAQCLSRETIMSLLHVLAGQDLSNLWLRVILCGEPQLEDRIQILFDELELAFTFPAVTLESMTLAETRAYLKHHLDIAGYDSTFPFSKGMVKHIHTLSNGFPGRVNRVAQQVLIDSTKGQVSTSTGSFSQTLAAHKVKLMSLVVLVGAAGAFWSLQQGPAKIALRHKKPTQLASINRLEFATQHAKPVSFTHQSSTKKTLYIPLPHGNAPQKNLDISQQRALAAIDRAQTGLSAQERAQSSIIPTAILSANQEGSGASRLRAALSGQKTTQKVLSSVQTTSTITTTTTTPSTIATTNLTTIAPTTASTKTPVITAPTAASTKATATTTKTKTTITPKTTVSAQADITTKPQVKVSKPSIDVSHQARHAAKIATNGFTLQLLGVHDKAKLNDYIERHHLNDNIGYYRTTYNGKPWYVLIYGEFDTVKDAHLAVAKLPGYLQHQHPWVKSFNKVDGSIHWLDETT